LKWPAALAAFLLALLGQCFFAQSQAPWTLGPGLVFFLAALGVQPKPPSPRPALEPPLREEIGIFFFLMLLAVLARLWRLNDFPTGLHTDQGGIGLFALRVLHEGWRPGLEAVQFQTPFPLEFYQLAGWFGVLGSSPLTFRLFFIFLSLAALPLSYWFFRRLAGPRIALLSLFFQAVMRWDWTEARNGHSSAEVPFYMMSMLVLFFEGTLRRKIILLTAAALFAGLGLYAYQSLKALPILFGVLVMLELTKTGDSPGKKGARLVPAVILLFALAAPLCLYLLSHKTFEKREADVFILNAIRDQKSLSPLLTSWRGTALMLNREGTSDPYHNLPGHRILDDGTAVLLILGLGWVWGLRKTQAGAIPLLGLCVMALPGLLAADPGPPHRFTGLMPFTAYIAAVGGMGLWDALAPWAGRRRGWLTAAAGLFLLAIVFQNAWTYFRLQAGDPRCRQAFGVEQNQIGGTIKQLETKNPGRFNFEIAPFYFRNPTVDFLAYDFREDMRPLNLASIAANQIPRDKPTVFFLEGGQSGAVNFLKGIFPGGRDEALGSEEGFPLLYRYNAPPQSLAQFHGWAKGLKGSYESAGMDGHSLVESRIDPLVNFSSLRDFPFTGGPPYEAHWVGKCLVPLGGIYQFQVLTPDQAGLWMDGRRVELEKPLPLSKGLHSLKLEFKKQKGYYTSLHLVWKKSGTEIWEVIPASAFGESGN